LRGSLLIATAALLWGLWPYWIHGAPSGLAAAAAAFAGAGVVGLPIALTESRRRPRRRARSWGLLALLGIADAGNLSLYLAAVGTGAVAPAILSHYLAPVLIAITAPRLLGETSSSRTPLALGLAMSGTAVLVFFGGGAGPGSVAASATQSALLLGAASAVFFASMVILGKKIGGDFGNVEMLVYHVLLSCVLLLVVGKVTNVEGLLRPAVGGVVSALFAGSLYYAGLRRVRADRAAILTYLELLSGLLTAWVAFGECTGCAAAAGAVLILTSGVLVVLPPRARGIQR